MDPEFVTAHRVLAAALLQAGDGARAGAAGTGADIRRSHPVLLAWLAHVGGSGCRAQAVTLIARARSSSTRYVPPFHLALAYTGLDDWTRPSRRSIRPGSIATPR